MLCQQSLFVFAPRDCWGISFVLSRRFRRFLLCRLVCLTQQKTNLLPRCQNKSIEELAGNFLFFTSIVSNSIYTPGVQYGHEYPLFRLYNLLCICFRVITSQANLLPYQICLTTLSPPPPTTIHLPRATPRGLGVTESVISAALLKHQQLPNSVFVVVA